MIDPSYTDVITRYKDKLTNYVDGINPYELEIKKCKDPLPTNLTYYDVVNYCIEKDSAYTFASFRSYKALEAYKFYESGWVREIGCRKITSGTVVIAIVNHSQRLREKPLHCWISVRSDGIVLCGHCTCMAGLGEICSHVGAVLFMMEDWNRKSQDLEDVSEVSCTDILAKWLVPSCKNVEMANVNEIQWTRKKEEKSLLEPLPAFSSEEIDALLRKIDVCPLMAHREPFANMFVSQSASSLPEPDESCPEVQEMLLSSFYDEDCEVDDLECLQDVAASIRLEYTDEQIRFVERKTSEQSKSMLWFLFRTGRVTGSNFKRVCRTTLEEPSISLIEEICYPMQQKFYSKYTAYGIKHEEDARQCFKYHMSERHTNFHIIKCGLIINNSFPHCGVTPDDFCECECCGRGCVEYKCPYNFRFGNLEGFLLRKDCPLKKIDGEMYLKDDHQYYYQVQMQIFLSELDHCDFVLWSRRTLTVTRVFKDIQFWNTVYPKTEVFFRKVLLPELIGRFYSRDKQKVQLSME